MPLGCPNKHAYVRPEDNFCWQCGAKNIMVYPLRCTCGQILAESDCYCTNCGKDRKLMKEVVPQPQKGGQNV